MNVFKHKDYKAFLIDSLPVKGEKRGLRTKLAEHINCQLSFVSLVLSTPQHHFGLEHGYKVCSFLNLSDEETDFFILLLSKARAGSKDLESYYDRKIREVLKLRSDIKERIKGSTSLSDADKALYYSDWYYTAIHMVLRCRGSISATELSQLLGITVSKVHESLKFLEATGIIVRKGDSFIVQDIRIHVGKDSQWLNAHHKNWRNRAILALDDVKETDLHYSVVTSISEKVAIEMRNRILSMIQDNEGLIKDAEDKTVYTMCVDFFRLA